MEKCDGTLDELFDRGKMDGKQATSALMQVIFTLLAYQKAFQFTHNDLHTNNIMYVNTDLEYLYYRFEQRMYKVPTYGRIYKIIDFGRSIYTFEKHVFCSDSFFAKGDAATQYNFGPCLDPSKPVLEPNPSFDLCRLGVSIFDFVMDIDTDIADMDAFQKTIRRWCQDDRKHNVLYKRNGDDRYPNFKLYKMIARTVHRHTPQAQLNYFIFRQHLVGEEVPEEVRVMNLDDLPTY
jgi:serine/threonine protein kinase